jgi:hypothetical protein
MYSSIRMEDFNQGKKKSVVVRMNCIYKQVSMSIYLSP